MRKNGSERRRTIRTNERRTILVALLSGGFPLEIIYRLLPVLEVHRESLSCLSNNEGGLRYAIENIHDGGILSANIGTVRDDLVEFIQSENCTDEAINEMINSLRAREI